METLGIVVDEVVITDELGGTEFRKPNETAFRLMQKKLQVQFEKMVYVEDNISKDFIAPKRLGMQNIWFRSIDGLYVKHNRTLD